MKLKDYEGVGRALILGILEYCELRKKSYLAKTKYNNLENLRNLIELKIMKEVEKFIK